MKGGREKHTFFERQLSENISLEANVRKQEQQGRHEAAVVVRSDQLRCRCTLHHSNQ